MSTRAKKTKDAAKKPTETTWADATLSEWHARRAPDVLERMRAAGAI